MNFTPHTSSLTKKAESKKYLKLCFQVLQYMHFLFSASLKASMKFCDRKSRSNHILLFENVKRQGEDFKEYSLLSAVTLTLKMRKFIFWIYLTKFKDFLENKILYNIVTFLFNRGEPNKGWTLHFPCELFIIKIMNDYLGICLLKIIRKIQVNMSVCRVYLHFQFKNTANEELYRVKSNTKETNTLRILSSEPPKWPSFVVEPNKTILHSI